MKFISRAPTSKKKINNHQTGILHDKEQQQQQTKHFHWSSRHSCLGKLSRLKNKHARKNVHASRLNANGSKMSTSSKSFNAACLQRFFFNETSKYRKTVVSSSNCDCVISVCTGKAECKQTERADEKQPSSYSYRCFWFTRLLR